MRRIEKMGTRDVRGKKKGEKRVSDATAAGGLTTSEGTVTGGGGEGVVGMKVGGLRVNGEAGVEGEGVETVGDAGAGAGTGAAVTLYPL